MNVGSIKYTLLIILVVGPDLSLAYCVHSVVQSYNRLYYEINVTILNILY